jgi:hypothetical protein
MNLTELGQLGLAGWRRRVVDRVADPVAERTPFSGDQLRALIGMVVFALSAYYVFGTVRKAARQLRTGAEREVPPHTVETP